MAKTSDTGVKQNKDGSWSYRLVRMVNGKRTDVGGSVDEFGNSYKTRKAALSAREARIQELKNNIKKTGSLKPMTIAEVYQNYLGGEALSKEPSTLKKQDSMWRNYIRDKFGNKYADEISMQELRDFLINLYEYQGKSYAYVEGFLKFFYLLFGMSRRCEAIDQLKYIEMFQTRGTRLNMPPRDKGDKEEPIEIYTQYEIGKLEELTIGGNLYTAFMLGFYCGLRIAETFGLRWSDIDWHSSTITINKQMAYEDGCFCLKPVKTLTSERIIDMSAVLHDYLYEVLNHQIEKRKELGHGYRATEKVIDKTKKGKEIVIIGGDFINRKIENGELLTINSVKYLTKKAKEVGINFHYHALRHTHATMMASLNTPAIELMSRLGHKKYDTSLAYYVLVNALTKDKLKENLKLLTTKDKKIVTPSGGTISSALLKEIQANLAKRTPKKR